MPDTLSHFNLTYLASGLQAGLRILGKQGIYSLTL
jgi:hypothetical protein